MSWAFPNGLTNRRLRVLPPLVTAGIKMTATYINCTHSMCFLVFYQSFNLLLTREGTENISISYETRRPKDILSGRGLNTLQS